MNTFRRILTLTAALLMMNLGLSATNNKADNIIGKYESIQGDFGYKVNVFKTEGGTYTAQIYWISNPYDKNGKIMLDKKNPDKELRDVRCDRVVIIRDLKYNPGKKRWDGTKIYDPMRGIRANVDCQFEGGPNTLKVHGSLMGFGETIVWTRIKE